MMGLDAYTKSLLHFDGADASTTFTDLSGKVWTVSGNAQIDTAQSKFGVSSGLFDGTTDYISTPNHADLDFGSGDWTIDFWIRRNGGATYRGIFGTAVSGTFVGYTIGSPDNGKILVYSKASGAFVQDVITSEAPADLTWVHVAVVRYGNLLSIYLAGVSKGSVDCTGYTYNSGGGGACIGNWYTNNTDYCWLGHIDELRVSKGIARWTGDFTPPTRPYSFISQIISF